MNKLLLTFVFLSVFQLFNSFHNVVLPDDGLIDFCWSHKYNQAEGKEPKCETGKQYGSKCYEDCDASLEPFGEGCRTTCPVSRDWRDDGVYCSNIEFTRPGFPVKFGELSNKGMFSRCESTYGVGSCEKFLSIVYPKCPEGYVTEGCCICKPASRPNCAAFNLAEGVGISCKKIYSEKKSHPPTCGYAEYLLEGKCYGNCKIGYEKVGTKCYSIAPYEWVNCGLGNAATQNDCLIMRQDKIFELYYRLYLIANTAVNNKCQGLCDVKKAIKIIYKLLIEVGQIEMHTEFIKSLKHGEYLKKLYEKLKAAIDSMKPTRQDLEEILFLAQALVNSFDPTLFVEKFEMFKYPICSKTN